MARTLSDYLNTDNSDPANYPDGRVKDDISGIDGTPIAESTWGDWAMFFDKMMRMAGTGSNNLPDNETNGYQLIHAMMMYMNAFVAPLIINLIGSGYSASAVYVLTGCETAADNGIVFYNGGVYFLDGFSGPACGGFTVQVLTISALNADSFLPHIGVTCGTSGTGLGNWTTLVRTWNIGAWITPTLSAGWNAGTSTVQYRIDAQGRVYIQGKAISSALSSPGTPLFTLPSGFRPTTIIIEPKRLLNISTISTIFVTVNTSGAVLIGDSSTSIGAAGEEVNLGSIIFTT